MDLIVGTNSFDHRIIAFSGIDGQILWQYDGGNGIKYQHLALLEDIDEDGKQDIVAGTGTSRFATLVLSGTTGSVIWLREGFQGLNNIFGGPVTVITDSSGSSQTIINFGDAGSVIDRQNWLRRLNSTNGNTVWENISPLGYEFLNITVIPDIDGDGMDDLVTPTSTATQKLLCISARLGKEIWMRPADVVRSPVIANLNGVGEAEIVVTEPNHFKTIALRSKDGSMLWQFVTGGSTYEDMPNGVAISEDLNGNGLPEVITSGQGKIYAVDGLGP